MAKIITPSLFPSPIWCVQYQMRKEKVNGNYLFNAANLKQFHCLFVSHTDGDAAEAEAEAVEVEVE